MLLIMVFSFISCTSSMIAKSMFRPSLLRVLSDNLKTFVPVFLFLINDRFLCVRLFFGSNCCRMVSIPSYKIFACESSFDEQTISEPGAPNINSVNASALQVSDFVFLRPINRITRLNLSRPVSAILKEYSVSINAFCHSINFISLP